jgi:hypothetical protein
MQQPLSRQFVELGLEIHTHDDLRTVYVNVCCVKIHCILHVVHAPDIISEPEITLLYNIFSRWQDFSSLPNSLLCHNFMKTKGGSLSRVDCTSIMPLPWNGREHIMLPLVIPSFHKLVSVHYLLKGCKHLIWIWYMDTS